MPATKRPVNEEEGMCSGADGPTTRHPQELGESDAEGVFLPSVL